MRYIYETLESINFSRVLLIVVSSAVVLTIIFIHLLSIYTAWKLTHPKRRFSDLDITPSDSALPFESVTFPDATGRLNLKGWYFSAEKSTKTVILCHGYLQNRMQFGPMSLDFFKNFLNMGYNVLTFDFRNCGYSEGNITSVGFYEKHDLAGAINWVRQKGASRIYLWGVSMGAATALITASENKTVNGVIADCPFSDLAEYLMKNLPIWSNLPSFPFTKIIVFFMKLITGIDASRVSPINALEMLAPIPVLFIHSKDDNGISVSDSRAMYRKYIRLNPGNAFIWDAHSAEHARSYELHPDEYMAKVEDFLNHCEKQVL